MTDPLTAPAATAMRAVLGAIVRHCLTFAGTALVAHGFADEATAKAAVPPIAEFLVGGIVILVAACWSAGRAWLSHTRWAAAWAVLITKENVTE